MECTVLNFNWAHSESETILLYYNICDPSIIDKLQLE